MHLAEPRRGLRLSIKRETTMKKIIALVLCCLTLTACAQKEAAPTTPTTTSHPPSTTATEPSLKTIWIYSPDENLDGFIKIEVCLSEVNEHTILEALIPAVPLNEDVKLLSLTQTGTELHLDMNEAFKTLLCSMGTTGERMIVGSLVNTFLTAYDAQTVTITAEGEIIESGHVIYDFPLTLFE